MVPAIRRERYFLFSPDQAVPRGTAAAGRSFYENGQVEVTFKYKDEFMNLIKYLEEKGVINDEKMEDWSVSKAII